MSELQMNEMTELEVVEALYAIRPPDERDIPCTWVEREFWRCPDVLVSVTTLEGSNSYTRRIYGWVMLGSETLYINGASYHEALSCALDKLREAAL